MTTTDHARSARRLVAVLAWLSIAVSPALAQADRIDHPVDVSKTKLLAGNRTPKARIEDDLGPLDPSQRMSGITLVMKPSAGQVTDIEELLQEQRDPSSQNYRKWLTPEDYANRFGLSRNDEEKVISWLEAEGFSVDYVARGRTWIMFSGTVRQVLNAFHTEVHRFNVGGKPHFANTADPSIPAALDPVVRLVRGLDDFRAEPRKLMAAPVPDFTSGGVHSLVPGDVATIYDFGPLYQMGINGSGQKIAVVGQTDIYLTDIQHFRSQYGLPVNNPQLVLVTGSADPGISSDDLIESSLDLEYSGGMAPNATIYFVYSTDVWTSIVYAVDQAIAPVISTSYGYCEPQISNDPSATAAYFQSVAQQANTMGITWLASSGDAGAADCDFTSEQVATQGLAVDLPASAPNVTGVGGTEFNEGSGNYWSSTNSANGSSALSYIPEKAWNDTAATGVLSSTGGGASIFFSKPAWQTGTGVPNDNARHVPDISFSAADAHDPYRIYSNSQIWDVGGTSVSTPVFSGALALLNQYLVSIGSQSQPGLGNINPALYRLAQTTPTIFHDVTVGNNIVPCTSGSPNCTSGQLGFNAGAGYDQATGLGSVDAYKLVTLWNGSPPIATTTGVMASVASISSGQSTTLTATVRAASGTTTPTGSVSFTLGQTLLGTVALSGSGGIAAASLSVNGSQLAAGANTITGTYAGSAGFTGSSASLSVTVATVSVTAVSVTPSSGSAASQTFGFVFSDSAGATDITAAQIGFNTVVSGSNACWMYYAAATHTIYLANNAGVFQNAGLVLGSAGTLQNSQCTVNVNASSVSLSGNTLTLNLALTFTPAFAGAKNTYLYVKNASVATSFTQEGTWTVPNAIGPVPVSVSPSIGSGSSQTFALVFSDSVGATDITALQIGFNTVVSGSGACWMYYAVPAQTLYLANDAGAFQSAGLVLGSAGALQNSQCTVNVNASSVSLSGNTLTLNVVLSLAPAFAGAKNIYMYAKNATVASGFVQEGTWTVPAATGPVPVSVTPNSGSGSSQTFTFAFSDSAGAADIKAAQLGFNTVASGSNACWMYYAAATQTLYLANDAGAFQNAGLVLGSSGTLVNSQCTVNVNTSSVSAVGTTLTLNLSLSFSGTFVGSKNIYMYVQNSTLSSGFMQQGTWTP